MSWDQGRNTIDYLIEQHRLERLDSGGAATTAQAILARAGARLGTARAALENSDVDGAYVNAYDSYRMSAEALLALQALRSTAGEGAHVTVEDAVSVQFSADVSAFAKPTFEQFRRTRHSAQYFDPGQADITEQDALWAIETAAAALDGSKRISDRRELGPF